MTTISLNCACGNNKFHTIQSEDGKSEHTYLTALAICPICIKNGGEFTKSPFWREPERKRDIRQHSK